MSKAKPKPRTKLGKQRARVAKTERKLKKVLRQLDDDERESLPLIVNPFTAPDRKLH